MCGLIHITLVLYLFGDPLSTDLSKGRYA